MIHSSCRRIVVKVGTSTLTEESGHLDRVFITDLAAQLTAQHAMGREVLLVTSGAIRAGRERLAQTAGGRHSAARFDPQSPFQTLPLKQAAAAVGQGLLMHTYTEAFAVHNVACAQVLLSRDDFSDRRRFLNARNTLLTLLSLGVIPVINENDTVAVEEIKFGDNDHLAALVATLVEADFLLILSDVQGLYERPPTSECAISDSSSMQPRLLQQIARVDSAVLALAGGTHSGAGTGGMRTKLEAARIASDAGLRTVIAHGRHPNVVARAVDGEAIGTTIAPQPSGARLPARKRWIAYGARARGSVIVKADAGACLRGNGVSLLAAGIVDVVGSFAAGDLIEVREEKGETIARGLTNYNADEVRRIKGLRSEQYEFAIGYRGADEIIHRDNLALFSSSARDKDV